MAIVINGSTGISATESSTVLGDNAVETADIAAGAVTAAKLASTLDLTGKTVTLPAGVGGKVLQVVSTTKTDTFSTSSTSYTDLTGLSVSITPTSSSSKILILYSVVGKQTTTPSMRLVRNSTAICVADASGGLNQSTAGTFQGGPDQNQVTTVSGNYLDSPATTSSTTYKVQVITDSGTVYYNRSPNDFNARYTSTITVMEIAA